MEKHEEMTVMDEETTEEVEEVVDETIENDAEEIEEQDEVTMLRTEVETLKEQVQEEENKYLRVLADYNNFKRRSTTEKEAIQKYKSQSVLTNMIPVLDNFERALSVQPETEEAKSMMEGMNMIYRSLVDALKSEGLEEIEAQDQAFDPNFHQAVMTGQEDDKESGLVLEEMQKGYVLKDRVLRPSMVKVNE